jgi:uncharacterized membrane protein required for colicin V production
MYADIFIIIFLFIAVIAGYISGGFRELLKLIIFLGLFFLFSLNSVSRNIIKIVGSNFYSIVSIAIFYLSYFIFYRLIFWSLKPLITIKEGVLGRLNNFLGIIAGFFKGVIVLLFITFLINFAWQHSILIESKSILTHSVIFMFFKSFF